MCVRGLGRSAGRMGGAVCKWRVWLVSACLFVRVSMHARGERGVYVIVWCAAYACVADRVRACMRVSGACVHVHMHRRVCMRAYAM